MKVVEGIRYKDCEWYRMPLTKKKTSGFSMYLYLAFYSLFHPEAVELTLFKRLNRQFEYDKSSD